MPLSSGGGQGVATLVAVALVAGLLVAVLANPAARAALARLWHPGRRNPVRDYLYGPPADQSPAAENSAAEQPADDDFDYSIFASRPSPGSDPTPGN